MTPDTRALPPDAAAASPMQPAGWQKAHEPMPLVAPPPDARPAARLDSHDMVALHKRGLAWYRRELDRQRENRFDQALDADFADGIQWDDARAMAMRDVGVEPLTYNVIKPVVNWVIGTQRRSRTDYKVLPRRSAESKAAERKTQLLKYLADVNLSEFAESRAFTDSVTVGVGWLESGSQADEDGEPVFDRYESWRNMLWDSAATQLDIEDGRYVIRTKWVDLDWIVAKFPDRAAIAKRCAEIGGGFGISEYGDTAMDAAEDMRGETGLTHVDGYARERVRVIEMWHKQPVTGAKRLRKGRYSGEIYDGRDWRHQLAVATGESTLADQPVMAVHVTIMTEAGLLWHSRTPYRHNRYPFTPIWGYRRDRDLLPYGIVRNLRPMQVDINERATKASAILKSNKVLIEENAVEDINRFADEVARPDAVLVYRTGKKPELAVDRELSAAHMQLFQFGIQMIQNVGGVTDENLGRQTNASSGIAIGRRQDQGAMATHVFFDNLRLAKQIHGMKMLAMVEQYFTLPKQIRIAGAGQQDQFDWVDLNDGTPEADIATTKADFVLTEEDWHATVRQAQVEALMAVIQKLPPQVAMLMLDLVIEEMDLKNRDEIVKRVRQMAGIPDPAAEGPTPQEIEAQQAKAEEADRAKRMAEAQIKEREASAAQKLAAAGKTQTETVLASIQSQMQAIQAALAILTTPGVAPVADNVLAEAGYPGARTAPGAPVATMMAGPQPVPPVPLVPQSVPQPVPPT